MQPSIGVLLTSKELWQIQVDRDPPRHLPTVANDFVTTIVANAGLFPNSNDDDDELKQDEQHHTTAKKHNTTVGKKDSFMSDETLLHLKETMAHEYTNETAFSKALFEALRLCLKGYETKTKHSNFMILMTNHTTPSTTNNICFDGSDDETYYAIGFVREVMVRVDRLEKASADGKRVTTTTPDSHEMSKSGHSVCLFRRTKKPNNKCCSEDDDVCTEEEWEPMDCFAVVKLNLSDINCCGTFPRDQDQIIIPSPNKLEDDAHDLLGQVICYTIDNVLLHLARRGKLDHPKPLLPLAPLEESPSALVLLPMTIVTAVQRENKSEKNKSGDKREEEAPSSESKRQRLLLERVRWVSAQLHVPKACGNRF